MLEPADGHVRNGVVVECEAKLAQAAADGFGARRKAGLRRGGADPDDPRMPHVGKRADRIERKIERIAGVRRVNDSVADRVVSIRRHRSEERKRHVPALASGEAQLETAGAKALYGVGDEVPRTVVDIDGDEEPAAHRGRAVRGALTIVTEAGFAAANGASR